MSSITRARTILIASGSSAARMSAAFSALSKAYARLGCIDYNAIERHITAFMGEHQPLYHEELNSILRKLPATNERDESEYKRKPWLRMQDAYNRQKTRRTGRPKKGR